MVLGQLHLEPSLPGPGPLGEDVQNQPAPVQDLDPQQLRQYPELGGGEVVVEDDHGGLGVFAVELYLGALTLADEGPGVRGVPVLQDDAYSLPAGGFHQGGELIQRVLVRVLVPLQHRGVQAH